MAEPSEIIESITAKLNNDLPLTNKKVLITAGPTHESIDPVRFIANRSSGKMGIALAIEAANNGALVILVLGPTHLECIHTNIKVYKVITASQMYEQVNACFSTSDIGIFAAAVADYKPSIVAINKIKKSDNNLNISLEKTVDILAEMGSKKSDKQFIVGFALETDNEVENAKDKLKRKNLDMIVLNSLNNKGAGFQHNTNKITIIDKANNISNFELKDKSEVAKDVIDKIIELSE
jgi:phosphopantothenoylcysteine decarboxylase/phosphopantothenate--cysteine ligase